MTNSTDNIKYKSKFYAWFILTVVTFSLSFTFELNGSIVFFGISSVYVLLSIVICLGKIFVGFFFREDSKHYVLVFTAATIMFASLDTLTHYRNSIGHDNLINFKINETERQLKSLLDEIKRIESNEKELKQNYGSVTKRAEAAKNLIERKDFLNAEVRKLNNDKVKLLEITKFDVITSIIKLICLVILELMTLACIKFKPEPKTVKSSSVSHRDIEVIKKVVKSNKNQTEIKYPFKRENNEDLFTLLMQFGLVFKHKDNYYTYSEDISKLQGDLS